MQVLSSILEGAKTELGPILESTLGSESGLQSFNFLGNSLLIEVDKTITENFAGIFCYERHIYVAMFRQLHLQGTASIIQFISGNPYKLPP